MQNSTGPAFTSGSTPAAGAKSLRYRYDTLAHSSSNTNAHNFTRQSHLDLPAFALSSNTSLWSTDYNYDDHVGGAINGRISRVGNIFVAADEVVPSDAPWTYVAASYHYAGIGTVIGVEAGEQQIALDRTWSNGSSYSSRKRRLAGFTSQAAGVYPGMDRFGRVVRHTWLDARTGYAPGGTPVGARNAPAIFEQIHTYDKLSNRLTADDGRTQASWNGRNATHSYDRLNRLVQTLFTPTSSRLSQQWSLDALGNWMSNASDTDLDESFAPPDQYDTRTHNQANELLLRQRTSGTQQTQVAPLLYDHAGNLSDEGQYTTSSSSRSRFYRHDAWNRLVEVREVYGTESYEGRLGRLMAAYTYNGLHWRIQKKVDLNGNGSIDRTIDMRYDASWRMVQEEHTDQTDSAGTVKRIVFQQVWGNRYIDDAIMRFRCENVSGQGYRGFYQLSDAQFSTVAVLDEAMSIAERVRYYPYGSALRSPPGDIDGNGSCDFLDEGVMQSTQYYVIDQPGYEADADIDRNGIIDDDDYQLFITAMNTASYLSGVQISNAGVDAPGPRNPVGYCGYLFNGETRLYTARFRHYSPGLGRWLERDPIGTIDGTNTLQYTGSNPIQYTDPLGLAKASCDQQEEGCKADLNAWRANCNRARKMLRNSKEQVEERLRALQEDKQKLPPTDPRDCDSFEHSVRGHVRLLIMYAKIAERAEKFLARVCDRSDPPPGYKRWDRAPKPNPEPGTPSMPRPPQPIVVTPALPSPQPNSSPVAPVSSDWCIRAITTGCKVGLVGGVVGGAVGGVVGGGGGLVGGGGAGSFACPGVGTVVGAGAGAVGGFGVGTAYGAAVGGVGGFMCGAAWEYYFGK